MGYLSEETTTSTTLPEMSPEEQALQAMGMGMIDQYMSDAGYDLTPTETYKNPDLVASLQAEKQQVEDKMNQIRANIGKPGMPQTGNPQFQLMDLQRNQSNIQRQLDEELQNKETTYDVQLNAYGQQVQALKEKSIKYQDEITDKYMENARKFLSGDYSITAAQKQQIEDSMSTIRTPVFKLLDEVKSSYEDTGKSMTEALGEYMKEINKTGLSFSAAMNAVDDDIDITGANVKNALANVNTEIDKWGTAAKTAMEDSFAIRKILAARDMEDYYKQNKMETANKAAALGRSPMDPQFVEEFNDRMARKIETVQLQMAETEAIARSGLAERIGMSKENLGYQMAGAEQQTGAMSAEAKMARASGQEQIGQRKEGATAQGIGIAERTGAGAEAVAGQKANIEQGLQETGQNLRWQQGMQLPAQAAGLGIDVAGYQQAVQQQSLANTASAMSAPMGQQQMMLSERMAQPTTTVTQSPSIAGAVMGTIGTLAGAAGSIAGGASKLGWEPFGKKTA